MRNIYPLGVLELKITLNAYKTLCVYDTFGFAVLNFGKDMVKCDTDDVPESLALCIREKTLCSTLSVLERDDMNSENHRLVIRSIGSQSVK